jgi:hypothetical protein
MLVDIGPYKNPKTWWNPFTWTKRRINVKIEDWDSISLDNTLTLIILPALKDYHKYPHGAPLVANEDVPEELRSTPQEDEKFYNDGDPDDKWHRRWDYVVEQMIWSFEQVADESWEDQFFDDGKKDWDGYREYQARIRNGLILFGKYFQALWL